MYLSIVYKIYNIMARMAIVASFIIAKKIEEKG